MPTERFLRTVALRAVDVAADWFPQGLGVLQAYVEREGDALVPLRHKVGVSKRTVVKGPGYS